MLGFNTEAKTVKELIEILSKLNPEIKLFSRYGEDGCQQPRPLGRGLQKPS